LTDKINNHDIGFNGKGIFSENDGFRHPITIQFFQQKWRRQDQLHPTQKPLALVEYLIKTYTNEGDLVLDNCMGSGTTCLAAKNLNRQFIGIEKEEEYYNIAVKRLNV
jgi:site-specific DNA-methyltransferase (adenine-specific)